MRRQFFILEVNDTQNESWQGTLKWVEKGKQESFRSMLELLRLIDSAVDAENAGWGKEEQGKET